MQDILFEQFVEDIQEIYHPQDFLLEVVLNRSPHLKYIDQHFAAIKRDPFNSKLHKALVSEVKKFTGIKRIIFKCQKDVYNACVIPVYNRHLPVKLNMWDRIKMFVFDRKNVSDIKTVDESSEYILSATIMFGNSLIKDFTARQLTSILLHELGHVYAHTSNLPRIVQKLVKLISGAGLVVGINNMIFSIPSAISLPVSGILFTITRSLTFIEHREEYKADKYASKYGYGQEMVGVLDRFREKEGEQKKNTGFFKKINQIITNFFFPSTHPESGERICKMAYDMKAEYQDMYPEFKKELITTMSELKCDSNIKKLRIKTGI